MVHKLVSTLVLATLAAAIWQLSSDHKRAVQQLNALRSRLQDADAPQQCIDFALLQDAEPLAAADQHLPGRAISVALILAIVGGGAWAYHLIDSLPAVLGRSFFVQQPAAYTGGGRHATPPLLSKQIAYHVDYWFSTNPYSKVLALLVCTVGLVFIGALGIYAAGGQSFYMAVWEAIAGVGIDWTFASFADDDAPGLAGFVMRCIALLISVGGLLITALMLGIVSESIGQKIEDLRKGKSEVLEWDHTLICGWSDKVVAIIAQLCNANESEGGRPIVVLANQEKEDMEAELAMHGIDFRGSVVVCRKGNPLLEKDLRRVSVEHARAIVVLSTCDSADQADARVLRTVLSLIGEHERIQKAGGPGLNGHIVAELADIDNESLVRMVGADKIYTVTSHDIIGRLMIQCARQPGLSAVWSGLLGFEGSEFYLKNWPQLAGQRFADVLTMFEEAVPIGVKPNIPDCDVILNPPDFYVMKEDDELLVLAEDDDSYAPSPTPAICRSGTCPHWTVRTEAERLLFIGWRRDLDDLIMVLDSFVPHGSELHLYNEVPIDQRDELLMDGGLEVRDLQNLLLIYKEPMMQGDVVDRKRLEELCPENFTSILILSDDSLGTVDSDSRSIAVSLLLRDIQASRLMRAAAALENKPKPLTCLPAASAVNNKTRKLQRSGSSFSLSSRGGSFTGKHAGTFTGNTHGGLGTRKVQLPPSESLTKRLQQGKERTIIISEILESRAKRIVAELELCEFVLSNELVSMCLAMVAENPSVVGILAELFTDDGNELYVQPAARYLHPEETCSFWDVMRRARQKAEIVVGVKMRHQRHVTLNPGSKGARNLSCARVEAFVVLSENGEG